MKDDIDDILRDNIPRIKRDPLFLQETLRRMDLVEGIKEEVDRQHRRDRFVLFAALLLGLALGVLVTLFVIETPISFSDVFRFLVQTGNAIYSWESSFVLPCIFLIVIFLGIVSIMRTVVLNSAERTHNSGQR